MINHQVLKRKAVSQRVRELSCSQTNRQTNRQTDRQTDRQTTIFTSADPLASLIAQPINTIQFNTHSLVVSRRGLIKGLIDICNPPPFSAERPPPLPCRLRNFFPCFSFSVKRTCTYFLSTFYGISRPFSCKNR